MTIEIVHKFTEAGWRDFVFRNPYGNVFHTPEMFQVFNEVKNYQPALWAAVDVVDDQQRLLALLLPVEVTLKDGIFRFFTTRAVAYGSVLWDLSIEGRVALSKLLLAYSQKIGGHAALFTELRNLSNMEDVHSILRERNFVYEPHLNYLIKLDGGPDVVFQNIGRRTRKNIRHALNRGAVVIEVADRLEQVAVCYHLLCQTYHAARVPLADFSLFESAFKRLHPKDMIRFTLAYVDNVAVAASVDLLYKNVIYGWYGGMDRNYGGFVPNELVMWHILEWGAQNGYQIYDFGGAGKPGEEYGVRDFKAKFGGVLVSYGRHCHVSSPNVFKAAKFGYDFYRRFL